jgi:hypothetical protein
MESTIVACIVASLFWVAMQPTSWKAATLPPISTVVIPTAILLTCASILALYSYQSIYNGFAELSKTLLESFQESILASHSMEAKEGEEREDDREQGTVT